MPKRKGEDRSDDYYERKIKKLTKKLDRCRRARGDKNSSSDDNPQSPHKNAERSQHSVAEDEYYDRYYPEYGIYADEVEDEDAYQSGAPATERECDATGAGDTGGLVLDCAAGGSSATAAINETHHTSPAITAACAADVTAVQMLPQMDTAPTDVAGPSTSAPAAQVINVDTISELDEEMMQILGEDPSTSREYGKEIQKDLAIRLNHIATNGLSKEARKELRDKYLVPANCKLIKAPAMNPELITPMADPQMKRDKGIEYKQSLTACALSSLSEAITLLLGSRIKNPDLLRLMMDAARIMGDIQYNDSISRRKFILSSMRKELKDQLEKTKIDEFLFGQSLPEAYKSAKMMIRTGAEIIRSGSSARPPSARRSRPFPPANNRPLNWRAPPPSRRPPPPSGTQRNAAPPTMTSRQSTHSNSSRASFRQPHHQQYQRSRR